MYLVLPLQFFMFYLRVSSLKLNLLFIFHRLILFSLIEVNPFSKCLYAIM